jgi:hypothetical protein
MLLVSAAAHVVTVSGAELVETLPASFSDEFSPRNIFWLAKAQYRLL